MSSLRNVVYRRAHKERAQPQSRKKFGLLEKHKDYVARAKAFHKKEEILQKLKEKAAFRNPDEFYFKMINSKTVDGVHRPESQANKYTPEELMLMKTQDIGYILQKVQTEKKVECYNNGFFSYFSELLSAENHFIVVQKIERLTAMLHSLDTQPSNKHVYYAEDREDAKRVLSQTTSAGKVQASEDLPVNIKRKTAASYRELEARKGRVKELEKLYMDMEMQKEPRPPNFKSTLLASYHQLRMAKLWNVQQKKGRKRKLREDEIVCLTSKPVFKWRPERKR